VEAQKASLVKPVARVPVTFRLHVAGQPSADATFWVAYGPLAGRFVLVQLRASGAGSYAAVRRLPATGRTVFAYLVGHGVVRTPSGLAPGDPVLTIERFGPALPTQLQLRVVYWHAPVG
jgi:hypothetical protein